MASDLKVLGVDLASSTWPNNGTAELRFNAAAWTGVTTPCINWPNVPLNAQTMANAIERYVKANGIQAVSLDGPQGWRDPNALANRPGVGRWCEYLTKTQGKTGVYGRTYPQTQIGWIRFCIDVFVALTAGGSATVANEPENLQLKPLEPGSYWLLESFPTNTWRTSGLAPLPGKAKVGRNQAAIRQYAATLAHAYGLPLANPFNAGHDDLQAVVCALPAAGLLGGPAYPLPSGNPASIHPMQGNSPAHRIEGIIWDAKPKGGGMPGKAVLVNTSPEPPPSETHSKIAIDDRDEASQDMLTRGVKLFEFLVQQANQGNCIGIGYADFACFIHAAASFQDITGSQYKPSDSAYVVDLALQVTDAAGGRKHVSANGVSIDAGMDTFVWPTKKPHERADVAFANTPYTQAQWRCVFPKQKRRLMTKEQLRVVR